jgi:hypothetical protein
MALHNATDRFRLLVLHGRRYQYVDRYETWVQYRSRRPLARVDMRPLAQQLNEREQGSASWSSAAPGSLTPTMRVDGESSLDAGVVREQVIAHLRSAPAAWATADESQSSPACQSSGSTRSQRSRQSSQR